MDPANINPDIAKYIQSDGKLNQKFPFPSALKKGKVENLTAEQMSTLSTMQATVPTINKSVTHQGIQITSALRWGEVCVTKKEADQFTKELLVQKPNSEWPDEGPLFDSLVPYEGWGNLQSRFPKMQDQLLPDKQLLFVGEQCAIWVYTSEAFLILNGTLNSDPTSLRQWLEKMKKDPDLEASQTFLKGSQEHVHRVTEMALSGINKLPPFKGLLYRGDAMPTKQLEEWKKGKCMMTQKMLSCSPKGSSAEYFAKRNAKEYMQYNREEYKPVIYVFESTEAKSISAYSYYLYESECVYPPGQIFRSVGLDEKKIPGVAIIYLKEVH